MTDSHDEEVDGEKLERAIENTQPLIGFAESLVDAAVAETAADAGRTIGEQRERMGDGYAYQAVEQNPCQKQLDDYGLRGATVEVRR